MQILAIVLREHHRDPFRSCREPAPIEVVCNCTEATPTAVASVSPGVLVGAGASIGAAIVGTCWWIAGCLRYEPAKSPGGRRRGGGVLSVAGTR